MTPALIIIAFIVLLFIVLWRLFAPPHPAPGQAVEVVFTDGHEDLDMLKIQATAAPKRLVLKFKDSEGNEAQVQGAPVWGQSDPALGTVTPAEDGLSAVFNPGSPSTGQINVTADADLGEGVKEIVGVLDVEVIAGEATVVEIGVEDIPTEVEGSNASTSSRRRR